VGAECDSCGNRETTVSNKPNSESGAEKVSTVDLGKNARLYLRHRWYTFEDTSFTLDAFKGRELIVELKAFF